ncbi:GNAT family N-acetyltransferase [Corynebacterium flavescens]|uniref:Amino acid acetyltransferase n=1 Tax=Corynebacterium flavescens TaxID=28028 RepID=A0A1L7CMR3_CORFL|nr:MULTISPECIES: GNAT family protein [Corynebacterium]APT87126.1 amino acid acetyltransferase [Corynebacterium flavescens]KAA8721367.1 GNAT family N-acetyltransferase [Corynebacterium flavescens]MDN6432113.1 GNAT family N-acetyltransferase [Corynebacterium flavescens]MDN6474703.1 GNAT family N-acetyltransferase [Corynebacterium flavescens]MDN6532375.1 GNAT family N-acetyltransferase [Corynebacterium flavescens]
MPFADTPILDNHFVRLEPLSLSHEQDLIAAVKVDDLWKVWYTHIPSPETMSKVISERLDLQAKGTMAPWAIIDQISGKAVGMTTFMNLDPANRRVEIGSTWLGNASQGTLINPAAKLLLLSRAFEELDCLAVEFRTHWHNRQSRAAIEKLGAKQDGVLRNHILLENGTVRDTVVFSIIESEWNTVRFALQERLKDGL